MNQILGNQILYEKKNTIFLSKKLKFKFIFYFSIIFIFLCIIFLLFTRYISFKNDKKAKQIANSFKIQDLYSESTEYIAKKTNTNIDANTPFVIGLLKINKINLLYPILSTTSDDLLKISPCRFYGPMPNEIGNLCIAGHNYADQTHFGKLSSLKIGDLVELYDLNSRKINYSIYEIKEVSPDETSCLNQNTNGLREITLVTCNTIKGTRMIIKAKEEKI